MKIRFIALEALAYLTTIEKPEKIIKIVNKEIETNNKGVANALS